MTDVWCVQTGLVPYEAARDAQRVIEDARQAGEVPDVLLLLEHPPVYTRGRRSEPGELPMGEEWYRMQGIEVCETDRGGRVTYHGPGQLVGYPIIGLRDYGDGVHGYVRRLERVMKEALDEWGVEAQVFAGLTGMWTAGLPPVPIGEIGPQGTPVVAGDPQTAAAAGRRVDGAEGMAEARKIGAIGVHVRRGTTTHGFAINVRNDLAPFEWIVPCGIETARATSLTRELGAEQDLERFAGTIAGRYATTFSRRLLELTPAELAERIGGLAAIDGRAAATAAGAG